MKAANIYQAQRKAARSQQKNVGARPGLVRRDFEVPEIGVDVPTSRLGKGGLGACKRKRLASA